MSLSTTRVIAIQPHLDLHLTSLSTPNTGKLISQYARWATHHQSIGLGCPKPHLRLRQRPQTARPSCKKSMSRVARNAVPLSPSRPTPICLAQNKMLQKPMLAVKCASQFQVIPLEVQDSPMDLLLGWVSNLLRGFSTQRQVASLESCFGPWWPFVSTSLAQNHVAVHPIKEVTTQNLSVKLVKPKTTL